VKDGKDDVHHQAFLRVTLQNFRNATAAALPNNAISSGTLAAKKTGDTVTTPVNRWDRCK
jgi:hypothetical protein